MTKTRVLVVDDSAPIRSVLSRLINAQPDMRVVGTAADPIEAREMVRTLDPDILTLDVEMPRMDGLEFLRRLMRLRPLPVIMISALASADAEAAKRALELGAADFLPKPRAHREQDLREYSDALAGKIRAALLTGLPGTAPPPTQLSQAGPVPDRLVAIGASTGGTEAIREVLVGLPGDFPPILITQHMPAGFTRSFAERLDRLCRISVKEAEDGERLLRGHAYVAPGNCHLAIGKSGNRFVAALSDGPPVNRHRPSVEVLFQSAARLAGPACIGVMLTGMGKDGASAMLEMRSAGAHTFAQDEASCVVFGMPREAIALGAVHEVLPLPAMARRLTEYLSTSPQPVARN